MAARALNAVRKHLLSFKHADAFTCGAFRKQMQAYLKDKNRRKQVRWKGARVIACGTYKHATLPDFYFSRNALLVGDYREWSKQER